MCLICGRLWTALQILWSTLYVICGAAQLMSGIFFTISVPELHLYNSLVAGSWNIIVGIIAGMVACLWALSPKRQEMLLYLAVSILTVACVNLILTEYWFYKTDMSKIYKNYANHMLIDYACFVSRISTAVVLFVSFLDSQFAFCSMQMAPRNKRNKLKGSHEHVSDIEYIIPRPKNSKPPTHTVYDAYAQSWVFDAVAGAAPENAGTSDATTSTPGDAPYFKVLQNGTPKKPPTKIKQKDIQNGMVTENGHLLVDNPVVHIEEASDDSTSNSDRKLCHMKSFSRSQSPVILSAGSSQSSLNLNQPTSSSHPPIYDCLEKLTETTIYRSRLNTAVSVRAETEEEDVQYQAPQTVIMRRSESTTPRAETVQYASLMKELQRAIVHKKEPPSAASPQSSDSSEKNLTSKSSDADFSKELEAALQLIQDLESPNTAETPSEPARPLAVWRNSDASEKTLSAVGSLTEIASPLAGEPPPANGKSVGVVVRYPDSQSTSGYSSPTHGPTPDWSTTSSISGSNPEIKSYSIRNTDSATVISLFSHAKPRSVTLVEIPGRQSSPPHIFNSTFADEARQSEAKGKTPVAAPPSGWKLNSLLRKKKQSSLPKMAPELEGAIIKSESLAYLSDLELLARHQRNKELQREIEKRVVQQLAAPRIARTESNC